MARKVRKRMKENKKNTGERHDEDMLEYEPWEVTSQPGSFRSRCVASGSSVRAKLETRSQVRRRLRQPIRCMFMSYRSRQPFLPSSRSKPHLILRVLTCRLSTIFSLDIAQLLATMAAPGLTRIPLEVLVHIIATYLSTQEYVASNKHVAIRHVVRWAWP